MREPDFERPCNGGIQKVYIFPNGWGASVVRHSFSYGHEDGLWELCVLKYTGSGDINKWKNWHLNYDHPVSQGDVRGYLSEDDVDRLVSEIEATNEKLVLWISDSC